MATVQAVTIHHGHAADYGSMGRPLAWYQDLAQHSDVTVVVIDMMTKGWAQDFHHALQAGLGATLFQGYAPAEFGKPAEAQLRARMMVSAANSIGLAKNSDVFLDWESVPKSVSRQAAIQWIDTWLHEVDASEARAGIYEGPKQPLTAQDFDTHFPNARRWKALSTVPQLRSGYVLIQTHGNVDHHGHIVDWDIIQPDAAGRQLTVTQAASLSKPTTQPTTTPTSTKPAKSGSNPSSTAEQKIATLTHQVRALNGLADDLRKALDTFHQSSQ